MEFETVSLEYHDNLLWLIKTGLVLANYIVSEINTYIIVVLIEKGIICHYAHKLWILFLPIVNILYTHTVKCTCIKCNWELVL